MTIRFLRQTFTEAARKNPGKCQQSGKCCANGYHDEYSKLVVFYPLLNQSQCKGIYQKPIGSSRHQYQKLNTATPIFTMDVQVESCAG